MSKYDGEIRAAGVVSVELEELLGALGQTRPMATNRHHAMAQYLSGEEGWRDARKTLRGTFAKAPRRGSGLTGGSDK